MSYTTHALFRHRTGREVSALLTSREYKDRVGTTREFTFWWGDDGEFVTQFVQGGDMERLNSTPEWQMIRFWHEPAGVPYGMTNMGNVEC